MKQPQNTVLIKCPTNNKTYAIRKNAKAWIRTLKKQLPQKKNFDFIKQKINEHFLDKSRLSVDVGANLGMSCIEYSEFSKEVHAYEPHPEVFKSLKYNIKNNKIKNVECYNIAIGKEFDTLYISDKDTDACNNIEFEKGKKSKKISIYPLDNLYALTNNLDFIKIDVEGFEMDVLKGGIDLIKRNKPIVQIEIIERLLKKYNTKPQDIFDYFLKLDYKIYDRLGNRYTKWNQHSKKLKRKEPLWDYFCFPNE